MDQPISISGAPKHSLYFLAYIRHEIQTMEFITLANIMASFADDWGAEEGQEDRIARFLQRLSFRAESNSFQQLWLTETRPFR
jgi:hypothetical protein